jgi:SAM-dependent methyltransferase
MNERSDPAVGDLPFTGERFIPGTKGEIWIEHWHRYHFAARWAAGKRVLDVACGEGYGTAFLARGAAQAIGVDLSSAAVEHARAAYAGLPNLEFHCAPCTRLPLPDASVDVAISFETIEHIAGQEAFIAELSRVLTPEGVLVLSCPNKLEYTDKRDYHNEFHVKELYRAELAQLLGARFPHASWYGQRPSFFSVIAPEESARHMARRQGEILEVQESHPGEAAPALSNPLYFLVVAAQRAEAVAALPPAVSVLSDRDDWVHRDYEKVMRDVEQAVARGGALQEQVRDREMSILGFQRDMSAIRAELTKNLVDIADLHREVALRDQAIGEKDRELARRRGLGYWLKLPLIWIRDLARHR